MTQITQKPSLQANPLDVPTAIAQRRSIKSFKSDPIAPELLKQLVELTPLHPAVGICKIGASF